MNAHTLIRPLILGVFLLPFLVSGQQDGVGGQGGSAGQPAGMNLTRYSDPDNTFVSNVPLNELNARAYRQFHRIFATAVTGEQWVKWAEGYKTCFIQGGRHHEAYFDRHGHFKYSLTYYEGKDAPRIAGEPIHIRFPEYRINIVTEIYDGDKTCYLVRIVNTAYIKTLSFCDGRIEVIEEMNNGGVNTEIVQAGGH